MKIFNLSLHRTATQSFHDLCRKNGLRSQHFPGLGFDRRCTNALDHFDAESLWGIYRPLVDQADAFSDLPCPTIYAQAHRDFPDAKFVLITRRPSQWIKSVRKHTKGRSLDVLERFMYWSICGERHQQLRDYSDAELEIAYLTHVVNVVSFMNHRNAAFKLLQIEASDFNDQLINFLHFNPDFPVQRVDDNKDDYSNFVVKLFRRLSIRARRYWLHSAPSRSSKNDRGMPSGIRD